MIAKVPTRSSFGKFYLKSLPWFVLGGFLAALGLEVFLIPNYLIDGGIVGLAMIFSHVFGKSYLPYALVVFNIPFVFLAYKRIGKGFVLEMVTALIIFSICIAGFTYVPTWLHFKPFAFHGDQLEVIVIGGFIIGAGIGLIIRNGGSTDGTEIMGIIINRKMGFTVGQVVLVVNIFIFALAGLIYQNWHSAFQSLFVYVVATKVMDIVIVGFDETKSVMIISSDPHRLGKILMEKLGVGLTVMFGRGGYSGDAREILYIVVERLQLAELKVLVHSEDPEAFIAIENLHEVINGQQKSTTIGPPPT
ncbi:MAG: YitT family protein [Chlamydiia bacterium]|nr:YitT family protein [Chlamydiia bacterium]